MTGNLYTFCILKGN